ncbi:MAG: hypothetical protein ACRDGG_03435 [Anaerolineae bacterium]
MDTVNVLILEPDPGQREKLAACLSREVGFRIVGAGDNFLGIIQLPILQRSPVDVLLVNIDQPKMAETKIWAAIRLLLPGTRIVALATGNDVRVLEFALSADVTALHRPDVEPDILRRAVRNAAQGVRDYDPWLIERVKPVLMRPSEETQIRVGELTIDLQAQEVTLGASPSF